MSIFAKNRMRALLIDDNVKAELKSLTEYAFKNQYSSDKMLDRVNGDVEPPGDDKNFYRIIPNDFKVVFTVETHPVGKFRHASISVGDRTKLPNPHACEEIVKMLDFDGDLSDCRLGGFEDGAIDIMQEIGLWKV